MPDSAAAPAGLSPSEAARRLAADGPNELVRAAATSPFKLFFHQFTSPLVILLGVACGVALALGEAVDAIAIAVIVLLNGVVGFLQEYRAEKAVLALRSLTAPRARVAREGVAVMIPAREVVVGDVLVLEAGDIVAADARVLLAHALRTTEATLTGESQPVDKSPNPVAENAPMAERTDRVFGGTLVANGTGTAEVTATGMRTELGRIAHLLSSAEEEETPLQKQLAGASKSLLVACLGVVAIVGVVGLVRGEAWLEVLMRAVALAVAAVPEGLPAVVTLALALGVRRMAARHVLVRKLPAVETLGAATVICTDKTGTLTTGEMTVREVWGPDETAVLHAGAACNDADLTGASGDPTELALLLAARAKGIERPAIEAENPRVLVLPFDADRKRMSIQRRDGKLYVKGATELLLPLCTHVPEGTSEAAARMAAEGLRVLAVAEGAGATEVDLKLLGLVGVVDPPRAETAAAVAAAHAAGIRTVMITGDNAATALAIARSIGVVGPDEPAEGRVYARVTPEQKLEIVRELKRRGEVVAMTGDGVNDAPALREAHIGIAMGRGGAEATREAADLVLTDDNFASIVEAVREGRAIWDNIRKTVVYLLTGNAGELILMLAAAIVGLPAPLLPLHLLWINLVTDGLPALALVVDPPGPDVLRRPPRAPGKPLLDRAAWARIIGVGAIEAVVVMGGFLVARSAWGLEPARSLAFSTLVFSEVLRAFSARDVRRVFWEVGAGTNPRLVAVVVASCVLQVVLLELPPARAVFKLGVLPPVGVAIAFALGLVAVTLIEVSKLVFRAWRGRRA